MVQCGIVLVKKLHDRVLLVTDLLQALLTAAHPLRRLTLSLYTLAPPIVSRLWA